MDLSNISIEKYTKMSLAIRKTIDNNWSWDRKVLAVKQVNTTMPIKEHKKYSYKLRGLNISHANHVWSTDITYIKIAGGMVYMAAIIDWHSKAVLSHRISNTMDVQLVMNV